VICDLDEMVGGSSMDGEGDGSGSVTDEVVLGTGDVKDVERLVLLPALKATSAMAAMASSGREAEFLSEAEMTEKGVEVASFTDRRLR